MRRTEDDEVRRLLSAAPPVRRMTEAERARTARFVAGLAKRPAPRREVGEVFRGASAAAAVLVVLGFCRGDVVDEEEDADQVSIAAEAARPKANEVAWHEPSSIPASREGVGVRMAAPGYGDICGARVCEFEPSCCEEGWDERCDRKLLELTRSGFAVTTNVGRCAWHDRELCPKCACPIYLKRVESREDAVLLGYDGGSGCLRDPARLLVELKWMCVEGYCQE